MVSLNPAAFAVTNPLTSPKLKLDKHFGLNATTEEHFRKTVHVPPLPVDQPGTTPAAELQWQASAKALAVLTLRKPIG
jgi:hypothetical protein